MSRLIPLRKDTTLRLSDKLDKISESLLVHWCSGCNEYHLIDLKDKWVWNGDVQYPTLTPKFIHAQLSCTYCVVNGEVHYNSDCSHPLAGSIVPIASLPH